MMNPDYLIRQSDLLPQEVLSTPISVIGAGAIGSFTVLALAKMGFSQVTVWDFDTVSEANMSCQWFRVGDIGKSKVLALQEIIREFTGADVVPKDQRWNGEPLRGIVISAVDSMEVRKLIWEHVKNNKDIAYLIDPRMAAEYALSFVIDPGNAKDQKAYETTLYSDADSVEERCTAKSTMYTAMLLSGYVAKHVKDILTENPYARTTQWNIQTNVLQNWMSVT